MTADQDASLVHHFAGLTDPRIDRTRLHDLLDIVVIALCAVVCGADSWTEVEEFGHAKRDWLARFLALPNGVPINPPVYPAGRKPATGHPLRCVSPADPPINFPRSVY